MKSQSELKSKYVIVAVSFIFTLVMGQTEAPSFTFSLKPMATP